MGNRPLYCADRSQGPTDVVEQALFDGVSDDLYRVGRIAGLYGILGYLNARARFRFTAIGTVGFGRPYRQIYDRDYPAAPLRFDVRFEELMAGAVTDVCSTLWAPIVTANSVFCGMLCHYDLRPRLAPRRETRVLQFVGEHLPSLASRELDDARGVFVGMARTGSLAAREMVQQLFRRETGGTDAPAEAVAAIQRVITRTSANLRRSLGDDGFDALLARALTATASEHPELVDVRSADDSGIHLDRVAAGVERHGAPAVAAALETVLAALIDVLSGLIGADMVPSLLTDNNPPHASRDGQPR